MRYLLLSALLFTGCESKVPAPTTPPIFIEANPTKEAKKAEEVKKVYTRAEFETLVVGKTQEEVEKAVGKPARTSNEAWTYRDTTKDPVTGKIDYSITVMWEAGKASKVLY